MGEYIKNKNYLDDCEIKVAVCRGSMENWESIFPLKMLKELSYLGYEDWYAGKFTEVKNGFNFLDTLIKNYDKTTKTYADSREFSEIAIASKGEEGILLEKMHDGEWDILLLHRDSSPVYVVSNYYIDEIIEEFKSKAYSLSFKGYEYHHEGKIGVYDFSESKDNGVQEYYHVNCPNNDSIEVMKNKGDNQAIWYAVYHNPSGGMEIVGSKTFAEPHFITGRDSLTIYQSKSHRDMMKIACDWYNEKYLIK